ncbi:putative protein of unknown function (DUF1963) [Blattamonas nauphoetae]|uniref:DUF1963 domain-containing protein n=1 Tax=Blattamonas nauphoetae TaxID=2049346 RepID=A0ABQ9YGI7_9EUKA|nr:putative protein of unknown function (DUF1963) [Blattamonas nauphoetae]
MTETATDKQKSDFLQKIRTYLDEKTKTPALPLTFVPQKTGRLDSKIGGEPYLPPGFKYPTIDLAEKQSVDGDESQLVLLAQLNFETLPHLPDFPTTGILQIYIDKNDDVYGINFDRYTEQKGWRIVYHPTIEHDESKLQTPPPVVNYDNLPFEEEHLIVPGTILEEPLTNYDYRFGEIWEEQFESEASELGLERYELAEELFPDEAGFSHKLGGYPAFTQDDPRSDEQYQAHDVLLLQINSDQKIMWGDVGIANFFISRDDLKACRFDRVMYNWDCS